MVKAPPIPAFIMVQPERLLQFPVVAIGKAIRPSIRRVERYKTRVQIIGDTPNSLAHFQNVSLRSNGAGMKILAKNIILINFLLCYNFNSPKITVLKSPASKLQSFPAFCQMDRWSNIAKSSLIIIELVAYVIKQAKATSRNSTLFESAPERCVRHWGQSANR